MSGSISGIEKMSMETFLASDMTKKVILSVELPQLTTQDYFRAYKIMPRSQVSSQALCMLNKTVCAGLYKSFNNILGALHTIVGSD